jgi:hypothetical protein
MYVQDESFKAQSPCHQRSIPPVMQCKCHLPVSQWIQPLPNHTPPPPPTPSPSPQADRNALRARVA